MTMDLLYNNISLKTKRRVHFHAFMLEIHDRLHQLKLLKTRDPISHIANEIAKKSWFLCLDELQVTDISDAMLLRQLFTELFKRNCVIVTTSNRAPDDLYKNGIQRKEFLPTIELLRRRLIVHSLDSGTDYRQQSIIIS
jgi:protein AFG1